MKKIAFGSAKHRVLALVMGAAAFASVPAQAAIDASVATSFAALETDAIALSAIVTPIVVAVLGLSIVIALIKKFGSKIG